MKKAFIKVTHGFSSGRNISMPDSKDVDNGEKDEEKISYVHSEGM